MLPQQDPFVWALGRTIPYDPNLSVPIGPPPFINGSQNPGCLKLISITINKLIRGGNRIGLIEDVAVDENMGSRGTGKALIEKLKEKAVERGCYKTILNCSEDNIPFYEKCDFYLNEVQMRWDRPDGFGPKSRNNNLF